ncbi:hypothetical protein SUGI_1139500 [Cryptomeria japonica]|nr:hypothetical protein SUGI_1139500 [Cryptomeria japonica]
MANRSDIGKKFTILFMVILIVGGAFMVEADDVDCHSDDDCGPVYPRCCPYAENKGFCCDPDFSPPD